MPMHGTTPTVTQPTAEPPLNALSPPAEDTAMAEHLSSPSPTDAAGARHRVTRGRLQSHCHRVPLPRARRPGLRRRR